MANESKSWIQKPEGKVGTAVAVVGAGALAVLVLYMWGSILPFPCRC